MSQRVWMKWLAVAGMVLATCAANATEATVAGDAYVNSAYPSTNFGGLTNLYVGSGGTALIQFDLSSLPAGTTASQIGKATLKLYVNRVNSSGTVTVLPITSTWSESSVTYSTIPTLGSAIAAFTPTVAQQFAVIDVTSLVQAWVTTPSSNFGVALTSTAGDFVFDSKENDETSHLAHLDVTVVSQGPAGAAGATGATGEQGPQGTQGATGAQGPQGPAGATGAQGPPVSFKDAWSSGASYAIGDAVSENGTSYIALASNAHIDPATDVAGSGGNWAVLAAKGGTGGQGPQGVPGPAGTNGTNGTNGTAGPQGPVGPAGPVANFKGAYSASTAYSAGDAVSENGSSYVALAANQNLDPASNPTSWAVLAAVGSAATVNVGAVTTGAPGSSASVGNSGSSSAAVLNFTVPQGATGAPGAAATVNVGTVSTGAAGSSASVTNGGTSNAAVLNFSIPKGDAGAAATVGVGTVSTGAPGSSATVTNAGTASAAVLNFTIPQGATGSIGAATEWTSGTAYAVGNVVYCNTTCAANGSSYVSLIASNTNHDPSANPSDWQMIAKVGSQGPTGSNGTNGTNGVVQAITTGTIANAATAGAGTASIGGTAANPNININFPNDVQSVSVGTVSNTASAGAGTLTVGGSATNPQIEINFPASSGGTGFTWSAAGPNSVDNGPDITNPLNISQFSGPSNTLGTTAGYAFVPTACTVKSIFLSGIYVTISGFSGNNTITLRVRHNGTDTSMSCSVTIGNGATATAETCSNTSNTFTVEAGDTLAYDITQTNQGTYTGGAQTGGNPNGPYNQIGATLVCQ